MDSQTFNNLIRDKNALDRIANKPDLSKDEKITIDILRVDTNQQIEQATKTSHTITN